MENALRAMDLVMDDRPKEAEAILEQGTSTYYKLARGVVHFIEATVGFEAEGIRLAIDSLHEAESASNKDKQKAIKNNWKTCSFAPGTEYALTYAEANLMGAISLFLSESVLDAAKAFLKLRKAYQALDELHKQVAPKVTNRLTRTGSVIVRRDSVNRVLEKVNTKLTKSKSRTSLDTESSQTGSTLRQSQRCAELEQKYLEAHMARLGEIASSTVIDEFEGTRGPRGAETIEEFIISGVNCMFGILQLVLSIIPPTLGKVMSIVGFKGDRDEGLKMLWRSAESTNIHGAIALLALLQFFDGPTQFADINLDDDVKSSQSSATAATAVDDNVEPRQYVPETNEDEEKLAAELASQPGFFTQDDLRRVKNRLSEGLSRIRCHYKRGALWQLQEGRMAAQSDLPEAVRIMDDTSNGPIQMKQVEGLMMFDKSIMMIVLHRYEASAENFIKLIDLSTWSHALYMHLAGSCYVEVYRLCMDTDPERAAAAKKKARECFEKAPTMLGKRKFMAKSMPFDVYVVRKISAWMRIASEKKIDLVDAVGTSPLHEAMYFWNGFSRMPKEHLEMALTSLGYSGEPGTPFATNQNPVLAETKSEALTRYLLTSITLRNLGRKEEGLDLLLREVIPHVMTPIEVKGVTENGVPHKVHYLKTAEEPWSGPSAIYERAIFEFQIHGANRAGATRDYLELAANWDVDYELSTRVGMKIKSARDKLESYHL